MKAIFVCGTDTGVGKTVVAGLFARYLLDKGYSVITQKWAETGYKVGETDIDVHLRLMGKSWDDFANYRSSMSPYLFRLPYSPHLAARLEGKTISVKKIIKELGLLARDFELIVIEGTGGLFVPLDGKTLFIDVIERIAGLSVLVVAGNRLGGINHTLLTIGALSQRRIKNLGIIFNDCSTREEKAILNDNPKIVERLSGAPVLGRLPNVKSLGALQRLFIPIGDKIEI